jgi:hypothetical protein
MCKMERGSWSELVGRIRRCGTKGDPDLKPYASAQISMELVRISELVPLAKYVLAEQLGFVTRLHKRLSSRGEDIFNLEYGILWPDGQNERAITCPIVEQWDHEGHLLVDGLHRVWVARDLGRTELACAVIRGVEVPLVPLPVTWEEVKTFPVGQNPSEHDKRTYRFADAAALRTAIPSLAPKVTEENFRYFLYRDLDELGSSGIRPPAPVGDPDNVDREA